MRTFKYFSSLAVLPAAIVFFGCSEKGGTENPSSSPSVQTSAEVQFVSRLADESLFSSDADVAPVKTFVNDILSGTGAVVLLDRTDESGVGDVAGMIVDSKKWSSFAILGQDSAEEFDVTTFLFDVPSDKIPGYQISSGSWVSGHSVGLAGTVTSYDADGNVTKVNNITISLPLYSCRFETEDQVNAFGGQAGVMNTLKSSETGNPVIVGTVKNGLMESLQTAVSSADSNYTATSVYEGQEYTIFMIYSSRYWGFNDVSEEVISGNIVAYTLDISWK